MTLLITTVGKNYALSCSDTRISVQSGKRYIPVDEKFNKHIYFHSKGLKANISYTGVAKWIHNGKEVRLYDIISESLSKSANQNIDFGPLSLNLISDLSTKLNKKILKNKNGKLIIEMHVVGYHEKLPIPFICVISTFRNTKPWLVDSELQWEYEFHEMKLYLKAAESPEVVFGGMDSSLTQEEKNRIIDAVCGGADAYNVSKLSSQLIKKASSRTSSIGPRSVSILMPNEGFLDTNLWEKVNNEIVAYLPRMVFPNGVVWGPSEFPADLNLIMDGHLPNNSIFFKSVIDSQYRRKFRRIIFRNKRGKAIPGIMGLLGLALFGKVPDDYTDFGLNHD